MFNINGAKPTDAMVKAMTPLARFMLLGVEGAVEFEKRQIKNKVTRKVRELPGTANAYKINLRQQVRERNQLIKATGCEDYKSALKWIRDRA